MEFQKLEPGVYKIRINPFKSWPLFHKLLSYSMVVEYNTRPIIVEFLGRSRVILQTAMDAYLEHLTDEDGFTIDKYGHVTNNKT